jgi:DNA polymerase III alpha subunit
MASDYFPVHAHSQFSVLDGMGSVEQMVETMEKLNQPALALTDHGTMAGSIRLYKECKRAGITPFPGSELYLVTDVGDPVAKERRYHLQKTDTVGLLRFRPAASQGNGSTAGRSLTYWTCRTSARTTEMTLPLRLVATSAYWYKRLSMKGRSVRRRF